MPGCDDLTAVVRVRVDFVIPCIESWYFVACVAKKPREASVNILDSPADVAPSDTYRHGIHQDLKVLFALPESLFGKLAICNVETGADDQS